MPERRITDAAVEGSAIRLDLSDGSRALFPLGYAPRLDLASSEQLMHLELQDDGSYVYWPELDAGLSLAEIEHWLLPLPEEVDPPHACDLMLLLLREGQVPIHYDDRLREYSLPVFGRTAVQVIRFCPFCGEELPPSVRDEWFAELERLDLEPSDDRPSGLSNGSWWRERGL